MSMVCVYVLGRSREAFCCGVVIGKRWTTSDAGGMWSVCDDGLGGLRGTDCVSHWDGLGTDR